jgi:hypothetical protein
MFVSPLELMKAWKASPAEALPVFDNKTQAPALTDAIENFRLTRELEFSHTFPPTMPHVHQRQSFEDEGRKTISISKGDACLVSMLMIAGASRIPICVMGDQEDTLDLAKRLNASLQPESGESWEEETLPGSNTPSALRDNFTNSLTLRDAAEPVDSLARWEKHYGHNLKRAEAQANSKKPSDFDQAEKQAEDIRRRGGNPDWENGIRWTSRDTLHYRRALDHVKREREKFSRYVGFGEAQRSMDILICAGVPGVSLTSIYNGEITRKELAPYVAAALEETRTPQGSPMNLISRLAATYDRLEDRERPIHPETSLDKDTLAHCVLLRTMVVPLARAVLSQANSELALVSLSPYARTRLSWLANNPSARQSPGAEFFPVPKKAGQGPMSEPA